MEKQLNFYLIRHGETEWNTLQLFQGSSDSPLTQQGINQAKLAGKALSPINFTVAYSSCQKRAIDTAKYIIGSRGIPLFFHEGLVEINVGKWEGKFIPDYHNDADFIHFENDAVAYSTANNQGENFATACQRSYQAIKDIINIHHCGNILLVSHGSLLRLLIHVLTGGDWQEHLQATAKLGNASITIINYQQQEQDSSGRFKLITLNNLEHLTKV